MQRTSEQNQNRIGIASGFLSRWIPTNGEFPKLVWNKLIAFEWDEKGDILEFFCFQASEGSRENAKEPETYAFTNENNVIWEYSMRTEQQYQLSGIFESNLMGGFSGDWQGQKLRLVFG